MSGPLVLLLLLAPGEGGAADPDLLRGAVLSRAQGAPNAARITDGVVPMDGDAWDTPHTAILEAGGLVEWDLGVPRHLGQLRLQADNNDLYVVAASLDGVAWRAVWLARPVGIPGMQTRTSEGVDVTARFLRLTAEGGDGKYSVSELEAFDSPQAMRQAVLKRVLPPPPAPPPPFNSAYLLVLLVAGYGAWLLRDAVLENRRRAAAAAPPADQPPRSP